MTADSSNQRVRGDDDGASLRTPRLLGERLSRLHEDLLVRWWSDPEFASALGGPRSPSVVRARIGVALAHWEALGYGSWIFRDRETGRAVGWSGLRQTSIGGGRTEAPGGEPAVELYYAVVPERRREGLGGEAAGAVVRRAAEMGFDELVAFILPENRSSRRLAERLGFREEGEVLHAGSRHLLYRLRAGGEKPGGAA